MLWRRLEIIGLLLMSLLLLLPAVVAGQSEQTYAGPPSIGQPLVREGDFALKLSVALAVGTPHDEVEAENMLAEVGVMPKNGWIADYPVTPDIIDELYKAVRDAAASDKIDLSVEVALQRLNDVIVQSGLSIETPSGGKTYATQPPGTQESPAATVINNYYQTEGPPVVTYHAPPPDYYYMYGWVPSPFWSAGIWFPGFFILNDFHRTVFIENRAVFVSNHFRDARRNRIVRIDPATRFNGTSISNTGVIHTRGFDPAVGSRRDRGDRAIMNETRINSVPNVRTVRPQTRTEGVINNSRSITVVSPATRNDATFNMPSRGNRTMGVVRSEPLASTSGRDSNVSNMPNRRGGFVSAPRNDSSIFTPSSSGRSFSMPSRDDRRIGMPSRGGGPDRNPFRGNSSSGGRGRR